MSEAATSLPIAVGAKDHSFLWRRLHSLAGILPIGLWLCYHIFENLTALRGPQAYDEMVTHVNTMLPGLYFKATELAVVLGPLLFHGLYGLYIGSTGQPNVNRYVYGSNWAYWMQRVSGYVAFLYIILHVGVLRLFVTLGGNHLAAYTPIEGQPNLVTYRDVAAHLGNPTLMLTSSAVTGTHIFIAYVIGTILTIYHFSNGINGFCWTWGISVGRVAQKRVRAAAWLVFAALTFATLNILFQMRFGGPA